MTNVVHATIWSIAQRYLPSLIHIVSTLVITRMLLPSEYGEVALVLTFSQIALLLVQSGFGDGLIYNANNTSNQYSTIFYINIIVGLSLYVILFCSSDNIARFYEIPRLAVLTKIICLNIVVFSLSYIQRCILVIELRFKIYAYISFISSVISSLVGIMLAYMGYGVWSLVNMTLLMNIIDMILLWYYSEWKPSLHFSYREIERIVPYSIRILLNNILQVLFDNIFSLVIGKVYNTKALGYYNRMQTVTYYTTTNLMYSIESVFFPMLSKKKEDNSYCVESYEKLLRFSLFVSIPVLVLLLGLTKPLIVFVLTNNWIGGVPYLQLLSIAFMFVPISYVNNLYLKLINRTDTLFYSNIVKKTIGLIILFVTIRYDILFLCKGIIVYYSIDALISMLCITKYLNVSVIKQCIFFINTIILNIIGLLYLMLLCSILDNYIHQMVLGVVGYITIYTYLSYLFKTKEYDMLKVVYNKLRN